MKGGFHYYTGELVEVGDKVRTGSGCFGIVAEVLMPGTPETCTFDSPAGGVLIIEDWNGCQSSLFLKPPDREYWEDVHLVEKQSQK